jgi:hypothetical protein
MKRANRLARHYIRAADLRAVYLASAGRTVRIGMTRDPDAKVRDIKRRRGNVHCVHWLASSASATVLIRAACDAFPGLERGIIVRPSMVKAALPKLAKDWNLSLTADDFVKARAEAVKRDVAIMSYGDYLERYKIRLLYEVAATARG